MRDDGECLARAVAQPLGRIFVNAHSKARVRLGDSLQSLAQGAQLRLPPGAQIRIGVSAEPAAQPRGRMADEEQPPHRHAAHT